MTQLSPQDHYNRLERRYQAWRSAVGKRKILAWVGIGIILGGGIVYSVLSSRSGISSGINTSLLFAFFFVGYACLLTGARIEIRERKRLPPVEDQIFYLLHSANEDLRSFGRTVSQADREHAVNLLTECATAIDSWTWGNLKFLQDSVGRTINEFKLNFRGRLLPAVKRTTSEFSSTLIPTIMEIEDVFDRNQLGRSDLEEWNKWLTRGDPEDPSKEKYPYEAPPTHQSRFGGLKNRKHHLTFLSFGLAGPPLTYLLIVALSLASHDAAIYGSVAVLGIVVAAYFAYLPLIRPKGRASPDAG